MALRLEVLLLPGTITTKLTYPKEATVSVVLVLVQVFVLLAFV